MNYEELYPGFTEQVKSGTSVKKLQELYNITRSKVYEIKNALDLINRGYGANGRNKESKACNTCGEIKLKTEFQSNGFTPNGSKKYKAKCKSCTAGTYGELKLTKFKEALRILNREYKCEECGYDKNYAALSFHHVNPDEKSFALSQCSDTASINTLVSEIKKCAILCANCHMEEHHPGLNNSV